jgi:hypothetical protein
MNRTRILFSQIVLLALLGLGAAAGLAALAPAPAASTRYNRDVRPILAEFCFPCHGPDSASRKAGLRLDREEEALAERKRGPAIRRGDAAGSAVVHRIKSDDETERMPPPETKKALKPEQIAILERWIAEGARYEAHWSFIAPERPPLPELRSPAWPRGPLDAFILAGLDHAGLSPAPEAERRSLARRASLDAVGLPPEPDGVETFAADPRPDAYERYLDRLLASPHWGEHRARAWLDAARYADTHGIHFDNFREMWSYRDWVIDAFNRNLAFDRFTIEQLAGDLLPERTLEQQIASGFNRCNITTNEGGTIPEEYLVLYTRDRTETASQIWLGLTAGCATCHDHKFDPLPQSEFYSMAAFFNNTTQGAMDGNIKDTPPIVKIPQPEDRERWGAIDGEQAEARARAEARRREAGPDFARWLESASPASVARAVPSAELRLRAALDEGQGSAVRFEVDGKTLELTSSKDLRWEPGHVGPWALKTAAASGLALAEAGDFERDQAFSIGAWVKLSGSGATGALAARMDDRSGKDHRGWDLAIENGRPGIHLIHRWPKDAIKVVGERALEAGRWQHVLVAYDGSGKASGVEVYLDGRRLEKKVHADGLSGSTRAEVALKLAQRETGNALEDALVQDLRIYARALGASEAAGLSHGTRDAWLLSKSAASRSAEESAEIFERWLASVDRGFQDAAARMQALEGERAALLARGTVAHVAQERDGAPMAYVLFRGDYDKRRDQVAAATPKALPPMPEELPRNRLGFAQWLLRPEHPLTARVTVNRFWLEVFGTGIVRTAGDFGSTGEAPSHPELLDWLAVELRERGWDIKDFFRRLLSSAAYRQSAQIEPLKLQKDPQNRLLSRGPRFRMEAEMVRDHALAASGLLAPRLGGPSVKPYQPEGVWEAVAMPESNTRRYEADSGESLYRRSLYTFWKRSAPPAAMDVLNAPSRETCTVRRERTNTPLQALLTLNDTQFVEAARRLAERALKQGGEAVEGRLDLMALRLLSRPLGAEEAAVLRTSIDEFLEYYRSHVEDARALIGVGESKPDPALDAAELAAWTLAANQLMNLDEVLNK